MTSIALADSPARTPDARGDRWTCPSARTYPAATRPDKTLCDQDGLEKMESGINAPVHRFRQIGARLMLNQGQ
jgi:hypothetical protein